jgi:hypothetical protein
VTPLPTEFSVPEPDALGVCRGDFRFELEKIVSGSTHDGQSQRFGGLAAHFKNSRVFFLQNKLIHGNMPNFVHTGV